MGAPVGGATAQVFVDPEYLRQKEERIKAAQEAARGVIKQVGDVAKPVINAIVDNGKGPSEAIATTAITAAVAVKAPCLAPVVAVTAGPSVKAAGDAIAPCIKDQTAKCFDERLPNSTDASVGASVDSTDPSLKKFSCV